MSKKKKKKKKSSLSIAMTSPIALFPTMGLWILEVSRCSVQICNRKAEAYAVVAS